MESGVIAPPASIIWDAANAWDDPTGKDHFSLPWLRETIYDRSERAKNMACSLGLHREMVEAYSSETDGWEWMDKELKPPKETWSAILVDPSSCPLCKGKGRYLRLVKGRKNGTLMRVNDGRCFCGSILLLEREWELAMAHRKRFREVRLSTLAPSTASWLPVERQQEIIDLLRREPTDSYLLQGAPGTGKSHYLTALHRHALAASIKHRWENGIHERSVWRATTATLLDEHEAWARRDDEHDAKRPSITVGHIQTAAASGLRPCLFLDEIDKIAATDHKTRTLFGLLEAVYEADGQVVATSNATSNELTASWSKFGDRAVAALRRVGAGSGAHTVTFRR